MTSQGLGARDWLSRPRGCRPLERDGLGGACLGGAGGAESPSCLPIYLFIPDQVL